MIWSIAWRNIWRNRTRSLVVILALTFGLFGTLFLIALSNGLVEQKVDSAIHNEVSHIQIHHPDFLKDPSLQFHINHDSAKLQEIKQMDEVKSASSRLRLTGMINTANNGTGVTLYGINPEVEKTVTRIHTAVIEGDYFERESRNSLILISQEIADKLKAKIKSKIVVTIQDVDGNLTYGLFRVTGIYKTSNSAFDEMNVFVNKKDLHELVRFENSKATEIAILLNDTDLTDQATQELKGEFPDLQVYSWKKLQPLLTGMSSMMDQFSFLLVIIILIALAFGIVNTMLMAILERTRELGMLMAVGMNRVRVFKMIMMETIFLSLVGAVIGIIISYATIELTGISGINFSAWAEGFESIGYSSHVYPTIYGWFYLLLTLLVIITATASSIFPARKALRLNPAEAVREDA